MIPLSPRRAMRDWSKSFLVALLLAVAVLAVITGSHCTPCVPALHDDGLHSYRGL